MKGLFIVLEGIDGCGKSTQVNHLSHWLPNSGIMPKESSLHITREPGGTVLGASLRELLLNDKQEKSPDPLTELLLYAADRAQHINQLIRPLLKNGDWVISDRFSGSTLAYQGFGRGLDFDIIKDLEKIATKGLKPDLTILLNLSVKESIKRREAKTKDRIEAEGKLFLEKVSSGFSKIASEEGWVTISAEESPSEVSHKIEKEITHFMEK